MKYSRREILGALAAGALRTAFDPLPAGPPVRRAATTGPSEIPSWEDYPLRDHVARFRAHTLRATSGFRASGLKRAAYLQLAGGIVRFFAAYQDARGAIIDPYASKERQYATPAFACATAILCQAGYERGLLPACVKAMDAAVADLVAGRAADNHSDFYTVLLLQAYHALRGRVPDRRRAAWRRDLARLDPRRIYRQQPDQRRTNNWNLVAASGEWLRHCAGMTADTTWVEASLGRQMGEFTAYGMYRDPNDPMAYDHFARYHVVQILEHGYRGAYAPVLRDLMERGAWTSLFMQSPHGELPCGGRSAHHQWNEAEQAVTYEVYARRFARRGDREAAGAFKRAAHLALRSVSGWARPSGELWIIKNRFDPSLRYGYEPYSFHSQYNLLTAAMLAIAYQCADDRIAERPCPADVGGFVFALQPAFHKVFANAGGMYLEIDTGADPHYNPTGILRVHHPGVDPQLSISDGVSAPCRYQLPEHPARSLAIGPAWRDREGAWHGLAEHSGSDRLGVKLHVAGASPDRVEFEVIYSGALRGEAAAVRQQFRVSPSGVEVADTVQGDVAGLRQYFPLLVTDGLRVPRIEVAGRSASATLEGAGAQTYMASGEGPALMRLGIAEPFRNGRMDAAYVESRERTMRYTMEPKPAHRIGSG